MTAPHEAPNALRALLDLSSEGGCLVDPADGRVVYANRTLESWLDDAGQDRSAACVYEWLCPPDVPGTRAALEGALADEAAASFTARIAGPRGEELPAEFRARRVDHEGRAMLALAIRMLPTAPARAEGSVRADPLTGLADRAAFLQQLTSHLVGQRKSDQRCAVLFVDVDGFKRVNDEHGHLVGDRVLAEVARRLAACVRADDLLARFGGDEFVVLLERVRGPEEFAPVVERIRRAFERPIALPEGGVTLSVSVGAAEAGPEDRSVEALIQAADRAMYAAKRAAS